MNKPNIIPVVLSKYAISYTDECFGRVRRSPTWDDVSLAYDAGLRHGIEAPNRKRLQAYIRALYLVNAPLPDGEPPTT